MKRNAVGHTISQLIRAAIDTTDSRGRQMSRADRVRFARRSAGAWKDVPEPADYLLTAWPVVLIGWVGGPAFLAFVVWYGGRKRTELRLLLDARRQLSDD